MRKDPTSEYYVKEFTIFQKIIGTILINRNI
jgi:hypothetical protein